jgi:hypothetical protein
MSAFHITALAAGVAYALSVTLALAEEKGPLVKGLQDNSFLIEEAYNQEPGQVQHIATLRRQGHDWAFNFTQEWPLGSQTHQFSYTALHFWLRGEHESTETFSNAILNYRYQVLTETNVLPAFAPRFSLITPTTGREKETDIDSWGYQVNLPFSKIVSDRVALHANAGLTSFVDVAGRQPTSYNLGGSAILALTRRTNLMLEVVGDWIETVDEGRNIERSLFLTVLPGIRHGINLPNDAQLVFGFGAPVSFSKDRTDYGLFFYLSLEHKFLR